MNKLKIIIASAFVVAIGIGIFLACQKEVNKCDLIQKDNPIQPIQFSFRALLTNDTAIDVTFECINDTVYFTYTVCEADENDKYFVVIYDPNNEYPITYNEDSTMCYGLNPYDKDFTSWVFRGEPYPGIPPSPKNPGWITPSPINPGGGTIESGCNCPGTGTCIKDLIKTVEGVKMILCKSLTCNCQCDQYNALADPDNYSVAGITSSLIMFQANVIFINGTEVSKGASFSLL